jgi:alkylation response protein AidB-like acyl-CoA dehydrogenase
VALVCDPSISRNTIVNTMSAAKDRDLSAFTVRCVEWLSGRFEQRRAQDAVDDDVAVFHSLAHDEELALVSKAAAWQREKFEAGYGAISWPAEFGGAGLSVEHERAFAAVESRYDVPADHELRRITTNLVAPTIRLYGSPALKAERIGELLSCRKLCCQLFSEPSAGSDLAGLGARAVARQGEWLINGAKIWVSGAQFADYGLLIARTDPTVPKHAGLTAFLLPMPLPGVEIRPIRQMTGGASFNEVFFGDVRIPDSLRVGDVGKGWTVALAMLTFERGQSGSKEGVGGSWEQLRWLSAQRPARIDPAVRQRMVDVYVHGRLRELTRRRAAQARDRGTAPGAEGSVGKLLWSQGLTAIGEVAAQLLGPEILADTGEPGTFVWSQHVLGAPGFRIAGGTDEIQRNIIAERILGLPSEPRTDRDKPWRDPRR